VTPSDQRPVVDLAVEGWTRLARRYGWDDGMTLRRPDPVSVEGPHDPSCGCVSCEGRIGRGPCGVRR